MKDEYSNCYWAGRLIDLPKDESWKIANEIVEAINNARKEAFQAARETYKGKVINNPLTHDFPKFLTFEDYISEHQLE